MASIFTGHVTHWACLGCSGSAYTTAWSSPCQYPATSHSHWRGVDQHSGHNQQLDQLYAKEMCCTAWGKWWSHQILTGFRTPSDPPSPPNTVKLHILEWPFIVASLRHTCAIIMLSNQHLDLPYLWGGWVISTKERNRPFVYIEKVLDLWVQLMKNGGKNKSVAFIILFSVYIIRNHVS